MIDITNDRNKDFVTMKSFAMANGLQLDTDHSGEIILRTGKFVDMADYKNLKLYDEPCNVIRNYACEVSCCEFCDTQINCNNCNGK